MGVFMITLWYPPHKAAEMGKIFLKQPRELPFISKWRIFNTHGGINGMKQYHLIYTDRGKLEEAIANINKYFMPPLLNIEGLKIELEVLTGVSDSFKMLGMEW